MTLPDFGLSILSSLIANKIEKIKNKNSVLNEKIEQNKMVSHTEEEKENEVSKLSKRFQYIFDLLSEKNVGYKNSITIIRASELLGLKKRSILENIVNGKEEATFDFIKNFCDKFKINYNWLNEGKGYPFGEQYKYTNSKNFLLDVSRLNPEKIYFIQNKSEIAQTFIMLGISGLHYIVYSELWHISSHVGTTGRRQIYEFYCLIKSLYEKSHYYSYHGLRLDSKEFYDIYLGRKFPGSCLIGDNGYRCDDPWWYDFIDIEHYYPISDSYEEMYGKSFIDAQNIVKSHIELYGE